MPISDGCRRRGAKVIEYWTALERRLADDGLLGTARNYGNARRRFAEFIGRRDIAFSRVTAELVADFERWLLRRGMTMNSVSFYLRHLRAVYNQAASDGWARPALLFAEVFTGVCPTRKLAVPESVIARLHNFDLSQEHASLRLSRDIFVFSYCARGMAFVDVAFLRSSDICGEWLSYERRKTRQRLTVRIEPPMRAIIDRYAGGEYVFPLITTADGADAYRQYQTALGYYNRRLKKLAEVVGIADRLSTYTARHSWATAARRHNVPLSLISAGLGHTSERTTLIYLDSVENVALDNANREILSILDSAVSP